MNLIAVLRVIFELKEVGVEVGTVSGLKVVNDKIVPRKQVFKVHEVHSN